MPRRLNKSYPHFSSGFLSRVVEELWRRKKSIHRACSPEYILRQEGACEWIEMRLTAPAALVIITLASDQVANVTIWDASTEKRRKLYAQSGMTLLGNPAVIVDLLEEVIACLRDCRQPGQLLDEMEDLLKNKTMRIR